MHAQLLPIKHGQSLVSCTRVPVFCALHEFASQVPHSNSNLIAVASELDNPVSSQIESDSPATCVSVEFP